MLRDRADSSISKLSDISRPRPSHSSALVWTRNPWASFTDFIRASISGPPLRVLLCAPLPSSRLPAPPIRRASALVQASYFLDVVSTRPLSFRHLPTGCHPYPPLSNPRLCSLRSARYLKSALRLLPHLPSLAGLIVIPCGSLHLSLLLHCTSLSSCDWSKLAWIIVVVPPYPSLLLCLVATLS